MEGSKFSTVAVLIVSVVLCTCMKVGTGSETTNTKFIKTCCNATRYPDLCMKSLSSYSSKIKTSYLKLVSTALTLSLTTTEGAYSVLSKLSKKKSLKPREASALIDCVEQLLYSIDEIKQSLKALKSINAENYDFCMSNVKTWLSAATTNEDTCLNGLVEESVNTKDRNTVKRNISGVAQIISNALALVDRASTMGSPKRRSP